MYRTFMDALRKEIPATDISLHKYEDSFWLTARTAHRSFSIGYNPMVSAHVHALVLQKEIRIGSNKQLTLDLGA